MGKEVLSGVAAYNLRMEFQGGSFDEPLPLLGWDWGGTTAFGLLVFL